VPDKLRHLRDFTAMRTSARLGNWSSREDSRLLSADTLCRVASPNKQSEICDGHPGLLPHVPAVGKFPPRMKSNPFSVVRVFWLGFFLICCPAPLRAEQFGLFSYKVVGGANVEIMSYPQNASGSLEIPSEIAGRPVTSIGDRAFQYCSSLTSVTIPASVISIGNFAFEACSSLTGVTIPASVTSIGYAAFYDCYSLTSIAIPAGVITIGGVAFGGCRGMTDVVLRDGVTAIGPYTFANCVSLTAFLFLPASPSSATPRFPVVVA
jgi:BspA type Leucine rich repeat region (6 copies)